MVLCLLFAMICFCWLQVVTTILRQNFKRWERKLAPPIQGHYYWPEKVKSPLEIREALLPQMTSSEYLEVLIMNEGKVTQETELSLLQQFCTEFSLL